MWWLPLIAAAKGAMDAKAARENQQQYNRGQAEVTRYSPLTGQTGQLDHSATPSMFSGGVAGGIQGLGIAQGLEKGMQPSTDTAGDLSKVNGGVNLQTGSNMFGGQNMASQLGQQFGKVQYPDYSQMTLQQPNYFASNK